MRLHAFAVGVASTVLLFAVNIKSSEQSAPAPAEEERLSGRAPIRTSRKGRGVTNGRVGRLAAAHGRRVCRGDEGAVRRHLQRVPQLHGSLRWSRRQPLWLGRLACGRSRSLGADPDEAEVREMPPDDATIAPSEEQIGGLVKFLEAEFARADASMKPDPGRVTRATLEPGRVHEHDPRPARDRVPRRQELPHRRFRRRLRQHRRRPDGLAGPDGEVPVCRRADRRAGDGGRAAAEAGRSRVQPALQEPPAARSEQRRSHAPLRFRRRLRAASSACRASVRRTRSR